MRSLLIVLVLAAGCGDDADPVVHVSSENAAWSAVKRGDTWTRFDDVPFSFSVPAGERFEVVTVCRTDIGQGWSLIGYADEPWVVDRPCWHDEPPRPATTHDVRIDVTGELDWATMGGAWLDPRGVEASAVEPGSHDLIAVRDRSPLGTRPGRVQLQRDVVVGGPRTIPVDVEQRGVDLVPAEVTIAGEPTTTTRAMTMTEGLAWFYTWPAETLPPSLSAPTDRIEIGVWQGASWADFEYTGPVDVVLPPEETDATFHPGAEPSADVETVGDWSWVSLRIDDDDYLEHWTLWVDPDVAVAEGRIVFTAPPFRDWNPAWLPDPDAPHRWHVTWSRPREGGGSEGRSVGGVVRP